MEPTSHPDPVGAETPSSAPVDGLLAWGVGAVLGLIGLVAALGGAALAVAVDRAVVAAAVRDGSFESAVLTEAQAIDGLAAVSDWSGVGLALAGVATALVGAAVVVAHRRARRRGHGGSRWIFAVLGACVGGGLWFLPLSPILGGTLSGYLDAGPAARGVGAGTLAGVVASLPLVVASASVGLGVVLGFPAEPALALLAVLGTGLLSVLAYLVGLSALGGFIGGRIRRA